MSITDHRLMESPAPPVMGVIADTLRASLRDLAQADARLYRGIADLTADAPQAPRWFEDSFFGRTVAPDAPKASR